MCPQLRWIGVSLLRGVSVNTRWEDGDWLIREGGAPPIYGPPSLSSADPASV